MENRNFIQAACPAHTHEALSVKGLCLASPAKPGNHFFSRTACKLYTSQTLIFICTVKLAYRDFKKLPSSTSQLLSLSLSITPEGVIARCFFHPLPHDVLNHFQPPQISSINNNAEETGLLFAPIILNRNSPAQRALLKTIRGTRRWNSMTQSQSLIRSHRKAEPEQ